MSSTLEKPDLASLADRYDIVGELGAGDQTKSFVGTRKSDGRDVLITVMTAADGVADGKAIAQFAADANLLATLNHPNVPQVIEGVWIGEDAFAFVADRVHGTTLAELMGGDRIPNPRIADILSDVDGVLEWARGERIVHRGIRPEGILVDRGTGKVYVSLSPTEAPKTNRPDPRDDARTIGQLATAMLTAKPFADDHNGALAQMRPDLPQRVVDATEKLAAITINDEMPDVSAYLASVAMADAIKEGEVEVARLDAEFRAAMKAEREKWEAEQLTSQLAAEALAKKFAEERAEYDRRSVKEREQLAAARAEIDKRRAEVQQARTELDEARAGFKQKKSELEARVKQIDHHAHDLEKQKRELDKKNRDLERRRLEVEKKNQELIAAAALAESAAAETSLDALKSRLTGPMPHADELRRKTVAVDVAAELNRPTVPIEVVPDDIADEPEMTEPGEPAVAELAGGIESVEDVLAPWTPIEEAEPWAVPFETDEPVAGISYEAAAVPEPEKKSSRRPLAIASAVAGVLVILVGTAVAINRHNQAAPPLLASLPGAASPHRPDTAAVPSGAIIDSAAGAIAPPVLLSDSAEFNAIRDSILESDAARREARRLKAEAAAAEEKTRTTTYTDSNGVTWTTIKPPSIDSLKKAKKDTAKVRPDTGTARGR